MLLYTQKDWEFPKAPVKHHWLIQSIIKVTCHFALNAFSLKNRGNVLAPKEISDKPDARIQDSKPEILAFLKHILSVVWRQFPVCRICPH